MAVKTMPRDLYKTIEKELKSREVAEAFSRSYEQYMEDFRQEIIHMYEKTREQNKYELRDELTKELSTKADLENTRIALKADIDLVRPELTAVRTELKAEIKVTNLKTMFQTAIIILIILATTPGGTNLLEKIFPFIK